MVKNPALSFSLVGHPCPTQVYIFYSHLQDFHMASISWRQLGDSALGLMNSSLGGDTLSSTAAVRPLFHFHALK